MNAFTWVLQIVLALVFSGAALLKLTRSREQLVRSGLPWVEDFSDRTVKLIGSVEVLAALGLILPAWTGIAPVLTPVAATGLAVVMVLAATVHGRRREYQGVVVNVLLLAMAIVVAWSRFGPHSY
ncbi:MAG: hypothetical protein V7637_3243 [Mycobacteriales bacterium]|jgi:hypothetical protein